MLEKAREYCSVANDGETYCLSGEDIKEIQNSKIPEAEQARYGAGKNQNFNSKVKSEDGLLENSVEISPREAEENSIFAEAIATSSPAIVDEPTTSTEQANDVSADDASADTLTDETTEPIAEPVAESVIESSVTEPTAENSGSGTIFLRE